MTDGDSDENRDFANEVSDTVMDEGGRGGEREAEKIWALLALATMRLKVAWVVSKGNGARGVEEGWWI